jgi:hypothetical protein
MVSGRYWCLGTVLWLVACGDDEKSGGDKPKSVTLEGATACERFASLARAVGCAPPSECAVPAACESQAVAWANCAATDLSQCHCETDGDINCEGSFKPNEGPARCIAEMDALEACNPS